MNSPIGSVFVGIDSAHDFVTLLTDGVIEAKRDIEADVQKESNLTSCCGL